jgi:excisionase family DNA binding protein
MLENSGHWLTVAQAAEQSGYAISTIQWLLRTGKIKGIKPGRDWLTTLSAVMEFKRKAKKGRPSKPDSRT